MENCNRNRPCSRPYQTTCGMSKNRGNSCAAGSQFSYTQNNTSSPCACRMPCSTSAYGEMYGHVDHMEPAMAYVPCQKFTDTYDLSYALNVGTIFPQLCKPFCGKRGVRK